MSWLLDAQNGSKLSTDNDQVVCSSSLIETPINALYESIVIASPGRYFIEFECDRVQESLFVGLTTKPAFKPGWNNKAYLFGGNLSNGSCLLVASFGNTICESGSIGLIADLTSQQLKIYLIQDGRPLGLAFQVNAPYQQPLYPVVQFSGQGRVRIVPKDVTQIDNLLEREEEFTSGLAGNWTLSKFVRQNAEQSLQSNYKVTLRWVSKQELRINIRIVNGVGTIARVNENDNRILEVEPLFSTMMAGPPEMMKDERNLSAALASLTAFQESGDQLLLNGNDFELHLSRYKEQFEPYTKDVTVAE